MHRTVKYAQEVMGEERQELGHMALTPTVILSIKLENWYNKVKTKKVTLIILGKFKIIKELCLKKPTIAEVPIWTGFDFSKGALVN